jgi:hypothetical protein
MPAILRIFRYQMYASQHDIGSYAQNERTAGCGGWGLDSRETCDDSKVSALDVESDPGG